MRENNKISYTINENSYQITRVFSEKDSLGDIILQKIKDEVKTPKKSDSAFTNNKKNGIIKNE